MLGASKFAQKGCRLGHYNLSFSELRVYSIELKLNAFFA